MHIFIVDNDAWIKKLTFYFKRRSQLWEPMTANFSKKEMTAPLYATLFSSILFLATAAQFKV